MKCPKIKNKERKKYASDLLGKLTASWKVKSTCEDGKEENTSTKREGKNSWNDFIN
jgi:hypothetical protein